MKLTLVTAPGGNGGTSSSNNAYGTYPGGDAASGSGGDAKGGNSYGGGSYPCSIPYPDVSADRHVYIGQGGNGGTSSSGNAVGANAGH